MVLFKSGDQVPVMPLVEVVGRAAKGVPEQMGGIAAKIGVRAGVMVMVKVVVVAHWPAFGVKV